MTINLNWLILLFVILKLTGIIHLSWWWIIIPGALYLFAYVGLWIIGAWVLSWALKNKVLKVTKVKKL